MTLKKAHRLLARNRQISQLARDLGVTPEHVICVLKGMSTSARVAEAALRRAEDLKLQGERL